MDIKEKEPDYWPLIRDQVDRDTLLRELISKYKKQPVLKEDPKKTEPGQVEEVKEQQYGRAYSHR